MEPRSKAKPPHCHLACCTPHSAGSSLFATATAHPRTISFCILSYIPLRTSQPVKFAIIRNTGPGDIGLTPSKWQFFGWALTRAYKLIAIVGNDQGSWHVQNMGVLGTLQENDQKRCDSPSKTLIFKKKPGSERLRKGVRSGKQSKFVRSSKMFRLWKEWDQKKQSSWQVWQLSAVGHKKWFY